MKCQLEKIPPTLTDGRYQHLSAMESNSNIENVHIVADTFSVEISPFEDMHSGVDSQHNQHTEATGMQCGIDRHNLLMGSGLVPATTDMKTHSGPTIEEIPITVTNRSNNELSSLDPKPDQCPTLEQTPQQITVNDYIPTFQVANIANLVSNKGRRQKLPFFTRAV